MPEEDVRHVPVTSPRGVGMPCASPSAAPSAAAPSAAGGRDKDEEDNEDRPINILPMPLPVSGRGVGPGRRRPSAPHYAPAEPAAAMIKEKHDELAGE